MRSIKEIENFEGKRVFIRADWNEPTADNKILDTSRIDASFDTINWVLERGGSILIVSHFGRESDSIKPAFDYFSRKITSILVETIDSIPNDKVVVLENIRKWPEEESNDGEFAKKLASLADLYVNEAFSTSHREHASIVGVPKFLPKFIGIHFEEEFEKLSVAFNPEHPFLFILGGAKFETKLPLVEKFLNIADYIFIGGALAKKASDLPIAKNPKIIFPLGDITALDASRKTLTLLQEKINASKFILWNGPLGKYEENYKEGTLTLAKMLAQSSARVIVGGGDTENVIDELGISDKFYFISLAGGAMLEFLSNETLPGIEALENSNI